MQTNDKSYPRRSSFHVASLYNFAGPVNTTNTVRKLNNDSILLKSFMVKVTNYHINKLKVHLIRGKATLTVLPFLLYVTHTVSSNNSMQMIHSSILLSHHQIREMNSLPFKPVLCHYKHGSILTAWH